ncbi:hypothetical protein AAFF_G00301340 [Aldrovandia affinis]|uniref:Uncharacterized protein n=1 Tax=Aldrovandia affinis TaxID=143900 RepID=A0AAD7WRP8_9TELE|nr:hypothetical protein AAFF_G00301340 [Aldrovandia affinis]
MAANRNMDPSGKQKDGIDNATKSWWRLRRYGRRLPQNTGGSSDWKVFEPSDSAGQLVLTIVQSGHLLLSQGQELLEGFSLIGAPSFLRVQQKSDILLFRMMAKAPAGRRRWRSVTARLSDCRITYPSACRAALRHSTLKNMRRVQKRRLVPQPEPEGSVSVRDFAQHFLGQPGLSLPMAYCHSALPSSDLGSFLRLCLLDHSFPALVEEVEGELKRLAQN